MPIKVATENRDDVSFVVYLFSGHIDPAAVFDAATRAAKDIPPNNPYRSLLVFHHHTDLSDCDSKSLATLYRQCNELYHKLNLGPRKAAAVLDGSMDAKHIMPLFNVLSRPDKGTDLSYELFIETEPALKRLEIPVAEGLRLLARAT